MPFPGQAGCQQQQSGGTPAQDVINPLGIRQSWKWKRSQLEFIVHPLKKICLPSITEEAMSCCEESFIICGNMPHFTEKTNTVN